MKAAHLLILALSGFLAATIAMAVWMWNSMGATQISGHGWAALTAGVAISLLVGGGLMALVFISSRRGYDDGVR
ncbi:MAG: hypothetical protein H2040_07095 [Euryhalocaulis sp.]|uniref:hypothetical protein n=1 Tax=Euryhalocaulis sp. TaxID=2744307 RepID=UPI0017C9D9C2|nr:hypothetical protein [Euryhalocaulis sp.]MBA4801613.1 hypothetical protein [Euryhalocaulis sp.]